MTPPPNYPLIRGPAEQYVQRALGPFSAFAGARAPRMLIVGEAFGETEEALRAPFCGSSGKELFRMIGEAMPDVAPTAFAEMLRVQYTMDEWLTARETWLQAVGIGLTNVLAFRPPGNNLELLCGKKTEMPPGYTAGPFSQEGRFLRVEYQPELQRLADEIAQAGPNLVLALGNAACWAAFGTKGIGALRGTIRAASGGAFAPWPKAPKALATYHPAGVLRNWSWRPIVVADLIKAWRESASPQITRPSRSVVINPTIEECEAGGAELAHAELLSVDIETAKGMITCVGFAASRGQALVVPFRLRQGNYWASASEEERAWLVVAGLLASTGLKLFQNGMYDLQYLIRQGLSVRNASHDTMLLHHSIYPEMQKGLGFLGSIYTDEPAWKLMRRKRASEPEKADE